MKGDRNQIKSPKNTNETRQLDGLTEAFGEFIVWLF